MLLWFRKIGFLVNQVWLKLVLIPHLKKLSKSKEDSKLIPLIHCSSIAYSQPGRPGRFSLQCFSQDKGIMALTLGVTVVINQILWNFLNVSTRLDNLRSFSSCFEEQAGWGFRRKAAESSHKNGAREFKRKH
jgi:hypothetical protein